MPQPSRPDCLALRPAAVSCRIVALLAVATGQGCQPAAAIRPDDIRFSTVPKASESVPVAAAPAAAAARQASRPAGRRVRYEIPEGWTDGEAAGMRLATLLIGDPAERREVTIIPASGTLDSNVARWQGQLDDGAAPETLAEKAAAAIAAADSVDIDGVAAKVVMLLDAAATADPAAGQAILAAVIPLDDNASLFVKFKGDASVARRERDRFLRFVSSIRWQD